MAPAVATSPPSDHFAGGRVSLTHSARVHGCVIEVNLGPVARDRICRVCRQSDTAAPGLNLEADRQRLIEELGRQVLDWSARPESRNGGPVVLLEGEGFAAASVQAALVLGDVVHLRARHHVPYFKIVFTADRAWFRLPLIQSTLNLLTLHDEIRVVLNPLLLVENGQASGPPDQMSEADLPSALLVVARERPVVVEGLFFRPRDPELTEKTADAMARCLLQLKREGAMIPLVQICSPDQRSGCLEHESLPLASLSRLARRIATQTGLTAEAC